VVHADLANQDAPRISKLKKAAAILGVFACLPILVYLLLLGASHVYVSGGLADDFMNSATGSPLWSKIQALDLPGLRDPGALHVDRVDAGHAIRNSLFMVSTAALLTLLPLLCLVVGVLLTVYGLFTAQWDAFGGGLLMAILLSPLTVILAILLLFAFWLSLLFQPCTPGHAILWLFIGLPFAALGGSGGAAPTVLVIKILIYH